MTLVGRRKLDHPALGTAGGTGLHASIETIYTNVGDDLAGRFKTASSVANSTVTTFEHNYGVQFADLKVLLYTGTHPNLVRVSNPTGSGWTIAATAGFLKEKIDITTPGSGGPHTFAVFIVHGRGSEKLDDLDDVDLSVAAVDGQYFVYDNASSSWKASHVKYMEETATITTNTVTPTIGRNIQRITGSAADLYMVASPSAGKFYVLINETGSNITVKNDTGATAANRIYTGTGVDFTLKSNAAISLIYDSGLSRWILAGGAGGGGLQPTPQATGVTAQAGTHYLTNTSGGAFTITLPAGVAGSVIMVSDANEYWDTNNLTVTPASGEKIDNLATNESLVCDVKRGWVELSWNTALSSWSMRAVNSIEYNAQQGSYRAVTGAYSIALSDYFISASGASNYAVTLPSAASAGAGRIFVIKSNMNVGIPLNISTTSSQTIDGINPGVTPRTIARFESLQLMSNGSGWEIF
jgi:hypothetical protein